MRERADGRQTGGERDHSGRGERVAKVIARAGLASRREAEKWILEGRVKVNAQVIASPAVTVTSEDVVAVDGQALSRRDRTRLFLFHKPRGSLTSHRDPRGRRTIFDLLPKQLPRLISVGRLDLDTEGLMLLTNDGSLARVLELPSTGWLRRYRVRAHGRVTQQKLDALRDGITIDGTRYGSIEAILDRPQGTNIWMTFSIREGKNREVKNVLGHLGLAVNRLIRVSFGPFQLSDLAPGEIEEVRTRVLRDQLGARIAALANADFSAPGPPPARGKTKTLAPLAKQALSGGGSRSAASGTASSPPGSRRHRRGSPTSSFQGEVSEPTARPWGQRLASAKGLRPHRKVRRTQRGGVAADHIGEPERARRERRRGRRGSRRKQR
jgi:23S rRNA pseudouridine2605 synthase